ncbi:MAG: TolC family protein [Alphaproteobacteria bacterium]|nr:TolC family protein [Alphaproteobacteria bacterium]HPF47439.1 TolC family protein [Emcibacteraceae bacterium]
MIRTFIIMVLATLTIKGPVLAQITSQPLYIEQAVKRAQENDPWIKGNRHMEDATKSMSVAAGSLPDPQISLGLSNLPTNNFSLNQDGMTQIRVGVSQMFPQGDSLNIKREQLKLEAHAFPYQRQDRKAQVKVIVSGLWLEAYRAQKTIELIENNRSLFEQLSEIAMSSYSAAMGKTRQQDIVRAQLELTRLNDRVTMLNQAKDTYIEKLSEWLSAENENFSAVMIADQMPVIPLRAPIYIDDAVMINDEELLNRLSDHPLMKALENKIDATAMGVDLARQKYKPSWGLNATYGHRSSDPFGNSRPDNVTVGISLSVPLFTANRQDKEYSSAISKREAVRTEKWQLLRKLKAGFETSKAKLIRLDERKALFENKLLPQMNEQAEASLTAYTNDDGDFAEVVRARIAELNAKIDALNIDVDRQKTILELNYYFTTAETENVTTDAGYGEPK